MSRPRVNDKFNPPPYCGLWCSCFVPGDGVGTRRCRLGHFDERNPAKPPRLSFELRIEQPRSCRRKL
jgi:hypothetical protein